MNWISYLKDHGCFPSVYKRGKCYRAHINRYGNHWAEGKTKDEAFEKAFKRWKNRGYPIDGEADGKTEVIKPFVMTKYQFINA